MKNLGKPLVNELRSSRAISGHGGRLTAGQGDGAGAEVGVDEVRVHEVRDGIGGGLVRRVREGLIAAPGESECARRDFGDLVARLERLRRVLPRVGDRVELSDEVKRRVKHTSRWNAMRGDGRVGSASDPTQDQ